MSSESPEGPPASESLPVRRLAHDLRNCLYALRTGVDLLKTSDLGQTPSEAAKLNELLGWMEHDVVRAASLVEKLVAAAANDAASD